MRRDRFITASTLAAGLVFAGTTSQSAVIVDTDFDTATTGTYGGGGGDVGTTLDGLSVVSDTTNGSIVAVTAGPDKAVQFTDNNTATNVGPILSAAISPTDISTGASGNNAVNINFDYTYLGADSGNPQTLVLLNSGSQTSPGAAVRAVQLRIDGLSGTVRYWEGAAAGDGTTAQTVTAIGTDLTLGTEYNFNIDVDLSSTTQDTFSLTIVEAANPTSVLFDQAGLITTVDDVLPGIFALNGGLNGGAVNAQPFGEIDNLSVTTAPIPEPSSLLLAGAGGALLLSRKRGANS